MHKYRSNSSNKMGILAPAADSKTTAVFDEVQPDQAGVYTCKATNWAGTVYKDVDFLVLSKFYENSTESKSIEFSIKNEIHIKLNSTRYFENKLRFN